MPRSKFIESLRRREAAGIEPGEGGAEIPPDLAGFVAGTRRKRHRASVERWSPEAIAARRAKDKERKSAPKRPRHVTPCKVDWREVQVWYNSHPEETHGEIAARFGVSRPAVDHRVRNEGWFAASRARQTLEAQGFYNKARREKQTATMIKMGKDPSGWRGGRKNGRGAGGTERSDVQPALSVSDPGGPFLERVSTSVPPSPPTTRAPAISPSSDATPRRKTPAEARHDRYMRKKMGLPPGPRGRPPKVVQTPTLVVPPVPPVSHQEASVSPLMPNPPPGQEVVRDAAVETMGHAAGVTVVDNVEHEEERRVTESCTAIPQSSAVALPIRREPLRVAMAEVDRADGLTEDEDQRVYGMVAENAVAVLQVAEEILQQTKGLLEKSRGQGWSEDNHGKPNETPAFLAGKGAKIAMELTVGAQEAYRLARGIAPLAPESKESGGRGKGAGKDGPLVSLNFNMAAPENPSEVSRMLSLLPAGERDVWMKALTPGQAAGLVMGERLPERVEKAIDVEGREG